jgi:glutamyl/glutaminyl-tRNA synthetase
MGETTGAPELTKPIALTNACGRPAVAPTVVYRGRLAPSPTGYLHLGHARTFWIAQQRARQHDGELILRNEDLDRSRVRPEYVEAMLADLSWIELEWSEGPDCGGPFGPYAQSQRQDYYRRAFKRLVETRRVYPCRCSRKDILQALNAPHEGDEEPIYPGTCRPLGNTEASVSSRRPPVVGGPQKQFSTNWRYRVTDGEAVSFVDGHHGPQTFVAGRDFGDFVVWRYDDLPSYQLAAVVDDHAMRITEVVRGADLLRSTARQLLLYRALGLTPPAFFHCPLVTDAKGVRLAKRHDALSLRTLRKEGQTPAGIKSLRLLDGEAPPPDNLGALCRKKATLERNV